MPTTTPATSDTLLGYNINPPTQGGVGAYGTVPGAISIPPSLYQQIGSVVPSLGQSTLSAADVIQQELAGELSPQTINNIQDQAARFGVSSGMPMSGLSGAGGLRSLGLSTEALQQQGLTNQNSFLNTLAGLMTPQDLAAEIASRNATMAAAPNPQLAAQAQEQAALNAMNQARGALTNPAGGTGSLGNQPSLDAQSGYGAYAGGGGLPAVAGSVTPQPGNLGATTFGGSQTGVPYDTTGTSQDWLPSTTDWIFDPTFGTGPLTGVSGPETANPLYDPNYDPISGGGYNAPAGTYYDPTTDTSNYDPFAGFGSYFGGTGPVDVSNVGLGYTAGGNSDYMTPYFGTSLPGGYAGYASYGGYGGYSGGYGGYSGYSGYAGYGYGY